MRPILAIARLTFAEGVRMRIALVFLLFRVASLLIVVSARGDGTVAGRLKNFLDYALASVAVLLSLTTIFFSCATLSGEFTTRTMHLLVTKPVTRLQILAGKWLGVNLLNLLILLLCGITIYVVATSIRNQPRTFRRDDINIRDAVWTARMAANPKEPDFIDMAFGYVRDRFSREGFGAFPEGERAAVLAVAHQAREA